ncbi:MAG TPA: DUF4160 domain-containing protein [Chloroflexota bacterium]
MPTVLIVGGNRFFFFSNEGSEPAHIHVENGDRYAKFWLDPIALAESYDYNGGELRSLRVLVTDNRALFLRKWREHFDN